MDPSRRRALRTLFCSSAALALNLRAARGAQIDRDALHVIAIGDFGTTSADQLKVAAAMRAFVATHKIRPDSLILLGDNFYSTIKGGFTTGSERWRTTFEDVYPAADFPGPCRAILGNHDYHDNIGGQDVQLAYEKSRQTRWKMPHKWYRYELGGATPLATVLALDTNLPSISGKGKRPSLTPDEAARQQLWLETQLAGKRAPFTIVTGHHPLYTNGVHEDSRDLIKAWGGLFQEHKVHAYLCGHDHDLQHLELEGLFTSFILSGGGGANTRELKNTGRKMPFGQPVHGFTHIGITADSLSFSHHGTDGEMLHRFTKKPDGKVTVG